MRATKEQKLKRDEAIAILWKAKKNQWTMKDLAKMFRLHTDTVWKTIKENKEREIIIKN